MMVGLEVLDQLHLALGLAAAKGHHRQAELFGAVVRAQAAGEQAVAVAHMHHVAGSRTGRADAARHHAGPGVDVLQRVAHHRRLARGAAGGMDARAALARHGEHAERVAVAQVLLGGERKLRQVRQGLEVVRMHAGRVVLGLVDRRIGVGVRQRGFQALELQRAQLVDAGLLDRLQGEGFHGCLMLRGFGNHRALDLGALAAEQGNHLAALVGDFHVVDAVAPLKRLLDAFTGQHVAQMAGLEELDAAARGHRVLVVAVAGKGKGGVRQREDEAAVADLVAVQVQLAHRHAHDGAARLAADQLHAHGVLGGRIDGEHGLPDPARQVAGFFGRWRMEVCGHRHSPLNCAGRFSRKAITPSM